MPTLLNISYDQYPKIKVWLGRIHSLDAWKTVDKKFANLRTEMQKQFKADGKI